MAAALRAIAQFGPKAVRFLKSAGSIISEYRSSGWNWVKDNISYIADMAQAMESAYDFKNWISDELNNAFN